MVERRMFERFKVDFPVTYINLKTNEKGWGRMIDISAGGGGMILNEYLQPLTPLDLQLQVPDSTETIYANGNMVWSTMIEPNVCRAGVEFDKIDFLGIARLLKLNYPPQ